MDRRPQGGWQPVKRRFGEEGRGFRDLTEGELRERLQRERAGEGEREGSRERGGEQRGPRCFGSPVGRREGGRGAGRGDENWQGGRPDVARQGGGGDGSWHGGRGDGGRLGGGRAEVIKFFKCAQEGHLQIDCPNPPICYTCKKSGHIAAECSNFHRKGIHLCGYGIAGQCFNSMTIETDGGEDDQIPIRGILTVISGEGSVVQIEWKLKYKLFKGVVWDWKVTAISEKTFLISFPSKEARRELTKFDGFDLSSSIKAKVEETSRTEESFAELREVWVKAYRVPRIARKEKELKDLSYLVGEPIEVDETSLRGLGPVRVKVAVCSPEEIQGSTSVFINRVGYRIRWETEEGNMEQLNPSPKKKKEEKQKDVDKDKGDDKGPSKKKGESSKDGEAKGSRGP